MDTPSADSTRPDGETVPGVIIVGFDAGLFFIDSDALEDRIRDLAHESEGSVNVVVIDFEGVNYIDSQGSANVGAIVDLARNHDVALRLARVKPQVLEVLDRDGVVERLGATNVFGGVFEAVEDRIPPTP